MPAVPMISVQQMLMAAKMPKVAPAVISAFIWSSGKTRGPISIAINARNQ